MTSDATEHRAANAEIVCDWTLIKRTTYRFTLSELVKAFPVEYADAQANGLTDREFVEESIDLGGADAGVPVVEEDWEDDYDWKKP